MNTPKVQITHPKPTVKAKKALIWIDLEMTGLDTVRDEIIEIATIVTDDDLNILAEGPVLAIKVADTVLNNMDDWNKNQHGQSGLIDRVRRSTVTLADAQTATLEFLANSYQKGGTHLALDDVRDSIRELRHYREHFFKLLD